MKTLWISLCVTLIVALVEAQENLNLPKPVITLEKRLGPPIWRRPPEDRRKLPLFPKNNKKFLVTERTTLKNEVTKRLVTTKRPLMRKLFVQEKIDERTWSFPPREPMKPKQFNVPVAPHPKRDYNRSYKVKKDDKKAEPSTVKTVATSVKTESSANKFQLNRGNLIQFLNKKNAYTNKASNKQANKVIQNNDSVKVNLPVKVFNEPAINVSAGSLKENMASNKINVQVDKATEKVFLSKSVDHVMQNNKLLNASTLDTVSEEYVNENDNESNKANVTQSNITEQLNKTDGKVFFSNQVDNVMQNDKLLNASLLDTVSEEYVDTSDYESSEANVTQTVINEQINKTAGKVFLSKQVDKVMQNNKSLNGSSLDTISEEYVDETEYGSSKPNVTQTNINEQLYKTTEKKILGKQVDNVMQNKKSFNGSSLNTVSKEYVDENDYESSETNLTQTAINEKLNKTAEKVFLSKQLNNISQNNDSLRVNVPDNNLDKYIVGESDSRDSHVTRIEIKDDEETEPTIIHNTLTVKPFNPREMLEGRSLDSSDLELNDQNDLKIFRLDDKQSSDKKSRNFSKLEELGILMKVIEKDTSSYSDHKLSTDSNAKPFSVIIQDINIDTVKSQPQEFEEISNIFYKEKPVIGLENENKISPKSNSDAAVVEVTEKYESGNIEIHTDYTHTDANINSVNNIMHDLSNLIEVIQSNSTSSESKADNADSGEYSGRSDTAYAEYDKTTLESSLYDSLAEPSIEITVDNLKTLSAEEKSEVPILIRPVTMIIDQNTANQITDNVISMDNNTVARITENIGDGNIVIFNDIINSNIEETSNENPTIDNLHDLAEVIKDKSVNSDDSVVAIDGTRLVNLDMTIVEEYSDKSNVINTKLDRTTQAFYLSDESLTESPIEIIFDNQEAPNTDKDSVEAGFNKNVHKKTDKSVINELIKSDEKIFITNNPAPEVSLKIENGNTNIESSIEILYTEQNSSENNENSTIIISLQNLDEVLNGYFTVGDDNEIAIGRTELLNDHINIADGDIDKPHTITVVIDETLGTKQDSIKDEHGTATSTSIFFNNREPLSKNLSLNVYTNKVTDQPVTDQLNLTEKGTDKVEDSVKKISLIVEDTITTSQTENLTVEPNTNKRTDSPNLINFISDDDDSNFGHTTEEAITATQLLNFDLNIDEANSGKLSTIVLDETTQKTYVNGEHVDHVPIGNLLNNLEPLSPNNEQLNMPINAISNESVYNEPSPNDEYIQVTEEPINATDKDNSDEWLVNSSNFPNDNYSNEPIVFKLNNPKEKRVLNEFNLAGEEISNETTMYNSINSSDAILNESLVVTNANGSSSTLEEMFEITIAQSDQSKKLVDEISNETSESNYSSNSVETQEEISDEITADKSENTNDEIPKESHVLNDSSSSLPTAEETSDEITADKSEYITDENSNNSHILNDSSSGIVKQQEISEEETADHRKNLTDKILNESHVLTGCSSSLPTTEGTVDEITAKKAVYITDEISNTSHFLNDNYSEILTHEELSDEMTADQSKNLTDEISNDSYVLNDSFSGEETTEEVFDEIINDESENLTGEIPRTDESHILNDSSSSIVTTEEIFDGITDDKSEKLTNEVSNESPLGVIHTSGEKSEELTEQSKNVAGEEASNEPAIDIRNPSTELASNEMLVSRIKRSNNIIEEENLATTLSGFKYTGFGARLDHDLRFKNINA